MRQINMRESNELQAWVAEMRSKGVDKALNKIFELNKSRWLAKASRLNSGEFFTACVVAHILIRQAEESKSSADMTDPIREFLEHDQTLDHAAGLKIGSWPRIARLVLSKNSANQLENLSGHQNHLQFATYLGAILVEVKEIEEWLNLHAESLNDTENSDLPENFDLPEEIVDLPVNEFQDDEDYSTLDEEILLSDASGVTERDKLWLLSLPKFVYVSPGSAAEAYHASPECKWLRMGRSKAATAGGYLGEIRSIPRVDTLRPNEGLKPRRPCQYCLKDAGRVPYREDPVPLHKPAVSEDSSKPVEFVGVNIGDAIEIIDGPFATLAASILEIDYAARKFTALVEIFGRETPIEVGFSQVQAVPKNES